METKCTFYGRLTADPESKTLQGGENRVVSTFSIATTETWIGPSKERVEKTHYFDFEAWGRPAEFLAKHARKGARIMIHAEARQDRWDDRETGNGRSRVVFRVEGFPILMDWPEKDAQGQPAAATAGAAGDEDVPF